MKFHKYTNLFFIGLLALFCLSQCSLPSSQEELHGVWLGAYTEYMPNTPLPVINDFHEDGSVLTKRLNKEEKIYSWSLRGSDLRVDTMNYRVLALSEDSLMTSNNYRFVFRRLKHADLKVTPEELRKYIENNAWTDGTNNFYFDGEQVATEQESGKVETRCWNIEKYRHFYFLYQYGDQEDCNRSSIGRVMQITKLAGELHLEGWNEQGKKTYKLKKVKTAKSFSDVVAKGSFQLCSMYTISSNHHAGKSYEGGGYTIKQHFLNNYETPDAAKGQSGFITLRFVVNCEGKSGRYEVIGMDNNFKPFDFNRFITEQLTALMKDMKGWSPYEVDGTYYDSYKIINLKIQDGQIVSISF